MEKEPEVWKDIEGYEGYYKVSSHGRIKSLPRNTMRSNGKPLPLKEKILMPEIMSSGYHRIKLCVDSVEKKLMIHRLVGKAFIPNPENKPEINHKDGIKDNNYYKNLEWVTRSENTQHSFDTGLQKGLSGSDNPKATKVKQYDLDGNYIKTFNTITQAANEVNGHTGNISSVCQGKRNKTYGYKWEYAEK